MKIILTHEESEKYFFDALCNGLGEIQGAYGLEVKYDEESYREAKRALIKAGKNPCYEDILMEVLRRGGQLILASDMDEDSAITIKDVHERVQLTPMKHLMEYINDTGGDAITADVILQTVFFGEVIYG